MVFVDSIEEAPMDFVLILLYLQDHISNWFKKNKEDVQNWKFVPIQKVSHLEPRGGPRQPFAPTMGLPRTSP